MALINEKIEIVSPLEYQLGQQAKRDDLFNSSAVYDALSKYKNLWETRNNKSWDVLGWNALTGRVIPSVAGQYFQSLGWTPQLALNYLRGKATLKENSKSPSTSKASRLSVLQEVLANPVTKPIVKTSRPVVTKTVPSTYKDKITIKDGTLYGSFPGYSLDQIIKAITGVSKSNTNNLNVSYSWERELTASEPAKSTQSQQFTKISGFKSKPIPTEEGIMSDEAAFMYRYPRKQVDVYNIQSPEAYDKIMAELKKIKGEGVDLAKGEYVFSTKELPITTANDSAFHTIWEPKEGLSGYSKNNIIDNKYVHSTTDKNFTTSIALGEVLPEGETTNLIYLPYDTNKEWEKRYIRKVPNTNNLYEYRSPFTDHKVWRDKVTSGNYDKYYIDKYGEVEPHVYKFETANGIITVPHVYYRIDAEGDLHVKLSDFTDTHSWSTQEPKPKTTFVPLSVRDSAQLTVDSTKQVVNTAKEKVKQGAKKFKSWLGFRNGGTINYLEFFK